MTRPGTAARLDALLAAVGLPGVPGDQAAETLLELAAMDKKAREGAVRWVLLEDIGRVARDPDGAWSHALDGGQVRSWLASALRATADVRDSAS